MTRRVHVLVMALASTLLIGCSSEYFGDQYYGATGHWTYGGAFVVGNHDRNGDPPPSGAGFSYYSRYRVERTASR